MISERSVRKQESHIDSIFDNLPQIVEQLDHEEMYFKYLKEQIVRLEMAVQQARKCSRKLSRSQQGKNHSSLSLESVNGVSSASPLD